jgi:hypothetical protein
LSINVDDILEFNYRSFTNLECALAVVAPEACLVVDVVVGGVLVDEVHRLVAGRALGGCPLKEVVIAFFPSLSPDKAKAAVIEIWPLKLP